MTEENLLSTQDLQKKFQEWFENPVPAEADHSIEDPVPAEIPFPVEADHSYAKTREINVYDLQKLLELFSSGCSGLVLFGVVVVTFLVMYIRYFEWGNRWPAPIVVIFFAMILGFWGGLLQGFINKLCERNSFKDEL